MSVSGMHARAYLYWPVSATRSAIDHTQTGSLFSIVTFMTFLCYDELFILVDDIVPSSCLGDKQRDAQMHG